jgi:membrane protein implicated in regulation of membrane protease activity
MGILGLIFVLIAPIFIYRTAKQNGHNPLLWAAISVAAGIGIQIILPVLFSLAVGIVMVSTGRNVNEVQEAIQQSSSVFGIICLVLSVLGVYLVMRRVSKIPEDISFSTPPEPPPFD